MGDIGALVEHEEALKEAAARAAVQAEDMRLDAEAARGLTGSHRLSHKADL